MEQRAQKMPDGGTPYLKEALKSLVQLCEQTDRPDQAAEWRRKPAKFDTPKERASGITD